jgi:hypothetical protein
MNQSDCQIPIKSYLRQHQTAMVSLFNFLCLMLLTCQLVTGVPTVTQEKRSYASGGTTCYCELDVHTK